MHKHLINSHFSGCRLLAQARDLHRGRDVKLYLLPTDREFVGVSDGTDSWIAPVVTDPFSVNIRRIMADLLAGGPGPTFEQANQPVRRKVIATNEPPPDPPPLRKRVQVITEPVVVLRKRYVPAQV